ncbi:MAG: hypothetical protein QM428_04050 [Verrucomicrobiota bacterium]|nr:hypothetical protein [Verrucomicrobiota bacterium]
MELKSLLRIASKTGVTLRYAEHTILKHPVGMPAHSQGSSDPW